MHHAQLREEGRRPEQLGRESCRIMRARTIAGEGIKRSGCADSSAEVLLKVLLPPSASNLLAESSAKGAFNASFKLLTLLCHCCMFRYSKNKIKARIGIRLEIQDLLCGSTKGNNLISVSRTGIFEGIPSHS